MAPPIDRRRFLQIALAAPAGAPFQRSRRVDPPGTVVVVGAGLAGLHAASILKAAGRSVIILEARPEPGGRAMTVRSPFDEGLYAEAGPIRIATSHRRVLRLARAHRLTLVPFEAPAGAPLMTIQGVSARADDAAAALRLDLRPDEKQPPRALLERYIGALPPEMADPAADARAYQAWRAYDRETWPDWLRSRGASPAAVTLLTAGGDSHDLSALYVLRQFALLGSSRFLKIRGGMDLLPKALASALGDAVRYNAAVLRVHREPRGIRIEYREGGADRAVAAADLILAIPFSTLRRIEIRPALSPPKTKAIAELPYYAPTRFLLQTRRRFWTAAGLSGSARTDLPAEIWDCTYDLPSARGILGATVGGAAADSAAKMTPEAAVFLGRDVVARTFRDLPANFEKGTALRWGLEPWSRGAFAVCRPGQMTAFMPDLAASEGRIHFAGEHTSSWMGWMEGALESGERAAHEVLSAATGSP